MDYIPKLHHLDQGSNFDQFFWNYPSLIIFSFPRTWVWEFTFMEYLSLSTIVIPWVFSFWLLILDFRRKSFLLHLQLNFDLWSLEPWMPELDVGSLNALLDFWNWNSFSLFFLDWDPGFPKEIRDSCKFSSFVLAWILRSLNWHSLELEFLYAFWTSLEWCLRTREMNLWCALFVLWLAKCHIKDITLSIKFHASCHFSTLGAYETGGRNFQALANFPCLEYLSAS